MNSKTLISIFIVVIVVIFAYSILHINSTFINPIDTNNEFSDYKPSESTKNPFNKKASYIIIGQIEEITNEEIRIRTLDRILTITKPDMIEYNTLVPTIPFDETQLQQGDNVRVTIIVDKTTNEVVKLSVTFLSVINRDGKI